MTSFFSEGAKFQVSHVFCIKIKKMGAAATDMDDFVFP